MALCWWYILRQRNAAFTGRVFGSECDDIFLLEGFRATQHITNLQLQWTQLTISRAMVEMYAQDRSYILFPGAGIPSIQPSDDVLRMLEQVAS